jgi:hypothetical protein
MVFQRKASRSLTLEAFSVRNCYLIINGPKNGGFSWLKPTLLVIPLKSEYLVPMHPFIHKIVIYGYENTA